jgi:hypothetical protein
MARECNETVQTRVCVLIMNGRNLFEVSKIETFLFIPDIIADGCRRLELVGIGGSTEFERAVGAPGCGGPRNSTADPSRTCGTRLRHRKLDFGGAVSAVRSASWAGSFHLRWGPPMRGTIEVPSLRFKIPLPAHGGRARSVSPDRA